MLYFKIKENLSKYFYNKFKNKNVSYNIFIYGDSHCKCFIRDSIFINNIKIYNKYKSGASLSGFIKSESSLNYREIIYNNIYKYNKDIHVIKLGQVDVEYVYYYKKYVKKENINIYTFIDNLLNKYIKILIFLNKKYNIVVCDLNFCSPKKWYNYLMSILKIKLDININYIEKNKHIIYFNNLLEKLCNENNITFLKINMESHFLKCNNLNNRYIGKDNHYKGAETCNKYKNENKNDKNYGLDTYFYFLQMLLKKLLFI